MTRLPDSRKPTQGEGVEVTIGISPRLQPLPPRKSTRLPPLKSQRLPDINPIQPSYKVSILATSAEPEPKKEIREKDLFSRRKGVKCDNKAPVITHRRETNEKVVPAIDKRHKSNDTKVGKTKDKLPETKVIVEHTDSIHLEEIKRNNSRVDSQSKLVPTCPKIHHDINKEVTWQKERDLLRKHRKQQAQRMNMNRQPVKAVTSYDKTGNETKRLCPKEEMSDRNHRASERQKIDLSVRRKCDDDEDWDWDKDIEEFLEIEEKQKTRQLSTSGKCTPASNGAKNQQTPVIMNCTKKGLGFKSKKRIEEEKQQELIRVEIERKEKERIEMMIPQKIRKDLKKYGFR
ncbi:uncharacterized protein LOC132739015 isoform X1 [Ruditapes philippinarum]|uniref:uncharacterized protein LOC132739015 isoform X1 n=1 Tax=Ruditapes philippinarum TaxID=129788 RepID=UPI00295AFD94|nr:uncharacterized protein LOC132739015 isoform X1 [Ruditapes philippinarum]